jgi:hypothetical protein
MFRSHRRNNTDDQGFWKPTNADAGAQTLVDGN